jgi:hypothetical protein
MKMAALTAEARTMAMAATALVTIALVALAITHFVELLFVVPVQHVEPEVRQSLAGSRRVLATAVDDWSGKPFCICS